MRGPLGIVSLHTEHSRHCERALGYQKLEVDTPKGPDYDRCTNKGLDTRRKLTQGNRDVDRAACAE